MNESDVQKVDKMVAAEDKWEKISDMKLYSVNNKALCQMNGVNYPTFSNSHRSACFSSNSRRHCSVNNIWSLLNVFFFSSFQDCQQVRISWLLKTNENKPGLRNLCMYAGVCLLNVSAMVKDVLCHSHWAAALWKTQICWSQFSSTSERHCSSGKCAVRWVRENN